MSILDEIANPTPPIDVGNMLMRQQQLKNARTQNDGAQLENQQRQMEIDQAQRQQQDQTALRSIYAKSYDPATQSIDTGKLYGGMATSNLGHMIPQVAQQNVAMKTAMLGLTKEQLAVHKQQTDMAASLAGSVLNAPPEQKQAAWTNARTQAIQAGLLKAEQAPEQYDPSMDGWLAGMFHASITASDQAKQLMDDKKFSEEKRHNQATEKNTANELGAKTVNTTDAVKQFNPATGRYENTGIGKPASVMASNLSLTPAAQAMAANLYSQTGQLPAGFSRSPQVTANVINTAAQQNPGADIAGNKIQYKTTEALNKDFFGGGKTSQNIRALNTAVGHLGMLYDAASAMQNGDVKMLNSIANRFNLNVAGKSAPAVFDAIKTAATGELGSTFKGSSATDPEIANISATISRDLAGNVNQDVIKTDAALLGSRLYAIEEQYKQNNGGKPAPEGKILYQNSSATMRRLGVKAEGGNDSGAVTVTDPRGVTHSFPNQAAADAFKKAAGIQ